MVDELAAERAWEKLSAQDLIESARDIKGFKPTDLAENGEEYYKLIARIKNIPEAEVYGSLMGSPPVIGVAA